VGEVCQEGVWGFDYWACVKRRANSSARLAT